jgi:hypothetical protein
MVRWVVVFMLALAVAGCGRPAPLAGNGGSPVPVGPACAPPAVPDGSQQDRQAIPDGFATAAVQRCRTEVRDVPGRGKWNVEITERADTPAADLVAQLRRPSDPLTAGPCTMELVPPPVFLLVDAAGRTVLPAVPTDACGKPRAEVRAALDALPFHTLSEKQVNQVQSQESVDSGCAQQWKDMLRIDLGRARPAAATGPLWPEPVSSIRVCVYGSDQASGGKLAGTRTVTGSAATALAGALGGAGAAASCPADHTRFAVLTAAGTGSWAIAELDGCLRLLRPDGTLGQLDRDVVAKLAG